MPSKKTKSQNEPAWGERNAITGYYSQYRVSAEFVIRSLRAGTLRWIAVADPNAQRVDDFQIATDTRIDAYQFKWSRHPRNFTFNDLVKGDDSSPGLIKQLADGWQHLKKLHSSERIVVHLVTNETLSISTLSKMPVGDPKPEPTHFAAFVEQVWKPAHNTPHTAKIAIPRNWSTTWEALREASGLSADEFEAFVRNCKLEFGKSLPKPENANARDAEIYEKDLNDLSQKLFEAVFEPRHIVRLDHNQLLEFLGWQRRFEFRNRHEFPVNETLYQPIEESKQELERALTENENGYVAVIGSPGSGKSSFLTQTLRYFPQRVIRYYAFIPDVQSANLRGESQNFLHDLVITIESAGFRTGFSLGTNDVGQLRERLHEQLQLLHQDYLKTNQKTIILVDGLDHIPREQQPARSLLKDLPLPEQIMSGVLFVLGSQTDELNDLPTAIQTSIRQPGRRIEIKPLSREAIQNIVVNANLKEFLGDDQLSRIESLSNGHPLALIYLLKRLESANSSETAREILVQTAPYDGKIEDYYQSFWRGIDQDDELADLLGLIARIRGGIDLNWIRSWAAKPLVRRLQRLFAHLFRIEKNGKWYFFHNSFRLFLIDRTAHVPHGGFDAGKDREIHLELAEKYAQATEPHLQWEVVHHLYQGGADKELLQKANSDFFREQFLRFRSAEAVRADIFLALLAAGRQRDIVSLVRQMLADAEMAQRQNNTERISIIPTLISLGETTAAIEYLRDGMRLRVSPKIALENSIALAEHGFQQEGDAVFELGEPLEYLSGTKEVKSFYDRDEHELLETWAKAAAYFRPVDKIIRAVQQVAVETVKYGKHIADDGSDELEVEKRSAEAKAAEIESKAAARKLQSELIYTTGLELLTQEKWIDLEKVKIALREDVERGKLFCFRLQTYSWRFFNNRGNNERARQILSETIEKIDSYGIDDSKRLIIAEGIFTVFGDKDEAQCWLAGVQPLTPRSLTEFHVSFSDFRNLFRQARLIYILGGSLSPVELIPLPEQLRGQAGAYCQRGVCVIAEISASAWRRQILDRAALRHKTFSLLKLFNRSRFPNRDEWTEWYPFVSGIKNDFYEELISAVALHGIEAVQDLAQDFAKEWKSNQRFWGIDTIQLLTLALYEKGADKEWAVQQFEYLAQLIAEEETYSRIEKSANFAAACLKLGEPETAHEILLETLFDSSSTGDKDYQLNDWLVWLQSVNRIEPDMAAGRFAWFVEAIVELERNGGPAADAAYDLIEIAFEWSPRRAVKIFSHFAEEGIINFNDATMRLVRTALKNSVKVPAIALSIFQEFVLPFGSPDEQVVDLIITHLMQQNGKEATIDFTEALLEEINIRALPEDRKDWLSYITKTLSKNKISLSEVGFSSEDLQTGESHSSDRELKLADGTALTWAEVQQKCQSFAGLRELIQKEAGNYYYWDAIVKNLLSTLDSRAEILEIAGYFSESRSRASAPIINSAAQQLLELGDEKNAKVLAEMSLALSQQSGWTINMGGGTKIDAYRILVQIDGETARREAFEGLIRDMSGEFRYTSSIIRDLHEILPLFIEQVPVKEIWAEIEQYVHSIFPSVQSEAIDMEWLDVPGDEEDNPANALNDFASAYLAHPVNVLSYASLFVYLEMLLRGDEAAENYVRQLLRGNEREQEAVIMIVDAAGSKDTVIIEEFKNELQELIASPNFALRFIARNLLNKIGISVPLRAAFSDNLSSLFKLSLPPGRSFDDVWKIEPAAVREQLLLTNKDSYEKLRIVLLELRVISTGTKLPLANLVERTAQIADGLAAVDEWSIFGEQKMQNFFSRANIKTNTYRKPNAIMARQALFHVVAELFDAGLLAEDTLEHWKWILDYYDPKTFFHHLTSRPDFIKPISGWAQKSFAQRQPVEIAEDTNFYTQNGDIILGEYTKLKKLDWETPTVIRQSLVCSEDYPAENGENRFFPGHLVVQVADYPNRSGGSDQNNATVVWHWERMADTPYTQWIAFNPTLARALNWNPDANTLFGWINEDGELMVWSVFWRDGLFEEQPPHLHSEVGEGWVVIGTPEALREIQNYLKSPLKQKMRIEQKWHDDGEEHKNSIVFVREVIEDQSVQDRN